MNQLSINTIGKPASLSKRLYYLDFLRLCVVVLVVLHHAAEAYAPEGGGWAVSDTFKSPFLREFMSGNATFFMGILFFLSGYVMPISIKKAGPKNFVLSKVKRLLLPMLFVMVFFFGPINYFMGPEHDSFGSFFKWSVTDGLRDMINHLWFIYHLFIYSLVFAGLHVLLHSFKNRKQTRSREMNFSGRDISFMGISLILLIALCTFLIRIRNPINHWSLFLGAVPYMPARFAQYLFLFLTGLFFGKHQLIEKLPKGFGIIWSVIGGLGLLGTYIVPVLPYSISGLLIAPQGGLNSASFIWSIWSSVIAVGFSFGLPVLLRELFDGKMGKLKEVFGTSYGIYLLHVFIVVPAQMFLTRFELPALVKFGIISFAAVSWSFLNIYVLRKIKAVRKFI